MDNFEEARDLARAFERVVRDVLDKSEAVTSMKELIGEKGYVVGFYWESKIQKIEVTPDVPESPTVYVKDGEVLPGTFSEKDEELLKGDLKRFLDR